MATQIEINAIVNDYAQAIVVDSLSSMDKVLTTSEALVNGKATKPQIAKAVKAIAKSSGTLPDSAASRLGEGCKFIKAQGSKAAVLAMLDKLNAERSDDDKGPILSLQNADFKAYCEVKVVKKTPTVKTIEEQATAWAAKHEDAEVRAFALALLATVNS